MLYVGNENGNVYAIGPRKVAIDIHPRSCPNPFNAGKGGVVPVAILGTADFDVSTIDVTTIRLSGLESLRASFEDVTAPVRSKEPCACATEGPDGFTDLTLKFDAAALSAAIGPVADGTVLTLTLTGERTDGTLIEGSDCIRVLVKGK